MKRINHENLANLKAGGCGTAVAASAFAFLGIGVAIALSGGLFAAAVPAIAVGFMVNGSAWATCHGQGWYS